MLMDGHSHIGGPNFDGDNNNNKKNIKSQIHLLKTRRDKVYLGGPGNDLLLPS